MIYFKIKFMCLNKRNFENVIVRYYILINTREIMTCKIQYNYILIMVNKCIEVAELTHFYVEILITLVGDCSVVNINHI